MTYVEAYIGRGNAYFKLGDNYLGCRDFKKACELGDCKELEVAEGKGNCR